MQTPLQITRILLRATNLRLWELAMIFGLILFNFSAYGQVEEKGKNQESGSAIQDKARDQTMRRIRELDNKSVGEYKIGSFFGTRTFTFSDEKRDRLVTDEIRNLKDDPEFRQLMIDKLKVKKETLVAITLLNRLFPAKKIDLYPDFIVLFDDGWHGYFDLKLRGYEGKEASFWIDGDTLSKLIAHHWEIVFRTERDQARGIEREDARQETLNHVRQLKNDSTGDHTAGTFVLGFSFSDEKKSKLVTDGMRQLKNDPEFQALLIEKLKTENESLVAYSLLNLLYPEDEYEILPDRFLGSENEWTGYYKLKLLSDGKPKVKAGIRIKTLCLMIADRWEARFESLRKDLPKEQAEKETSVNPEKDEEK